MNIWRIFIAVVELRNNSISLLHWYDVGSWEEWPCWRCICGLVSYYEEYGTDPWFTASGIHDEYGNCFWDARIYFAEESFNSMVKTGEHIKTDKLFMDKLSMDILDELSSIHSMDKLSTLSMRPFTMMWTMRWLFIAQGRNISTEMIVQGGHLGVPEVSCSTHHNS